MNRKRFLIDLLATGCFVATSMLVPTVGYAQADPKVQKAMAALKAETSKLGAPKIDGMEAVSGKDASALYFDKTKVNNNFEIVDAVTKEHGGTATLFAKTGDEFVRVSTNVPKPDNTPVSKAGAIVYATVEGRPGKYAVLAGDPLTYRSTGVAWSGVTTMYGNDDNGSGTASGRRFDENEFTCAHKTLPFGTRLAVTKGSKSVIVTVTDRGPYTPGRMLDLTRRAGRYLGIDGVGTVKVEIVKPVR